MKMLDISGQLSATVPGSLHVEDVVKLCMIGAILGIPSGAEVTQIHCEESFHAPTETTASRFSIHWRIAEASVMPTNGQREDQAEGQPDPTM